MGDIGQIPVLALIVSDTTAQATLLAVSEKQVVLQQRSTIHRYTSTESFIVQLDEALQELGSESESVHDVIFICDPHWFSASALKKDKEDLIQKAAQELSLNALGFVLTHEALVHAEAAAQAQVSKLLVIASEAAVSTVLISQGALLHTASSGRNGDIQQDVIDLLLPFLKTQTQIQLPAQISVAGTGMQDVDIRSLVAAFDMESLSHALPFVAAPHIDVVTAEQVTAMVIQEAGRAVAVAKGITPPAIHLGGAQQHESTAAETSVEQPEIAKSFGVELGSADHIKSEELRPVAPSELQGSGDLSSIGDNPAARDFDFDADADKTSWWASKSHRYFAGIGFGVGVLALIVGCIVYLHQFSTVVVSVVRQPEIVSDDLSLVLDTSITESNAETLQIAAEEVFVEVSDTATAATSGVTIVGEAATGRVVVLNKTTGEKEFDAGTTITAGEQQFTFDDAVVVPPAVVTEKTGGEEREYGTATVAVTAAAIGEEGNVSEGTQFSVASFSDSSFTARAEESFSGGTSREVSVVSENDRSELLAELKKQLLETAAEELRSQADQGIYIHTTNTIAEEASVFSAEVAAEASELQLELTLTVSALSYSAEGMKPIIISALSASIPEGYSLSEKDPDILSAPEEATSSAAEQRIAANISTEAVPTVSDEAVRSLIGVKTFEDATASLVNHDHIQSANIVVVPELARFFVDRLPQNTERIEVVVQ